MSHPDTISFILDGILQLKNENIKKKCQYEFKRMRKPEVKNNNKSIYDMDAPDPKLATKINMSTSC
jgi:protein-tyrosine-phosphatase